MILVMLGVLFHERFPIGLRAVFAAMSKGECKASCSAGQRDWTFERMSAS